MVLEEGHVNQRFFMQPSSDAVNVYYSLGSGNDSSYTATMHFSFTALINPEVEPHELKTGCMARAAEVIRDPS